MKTINRLPCLPEASKTSPECFISIKLLINAFSFLQRVDWKKANKSSKNVQKYLCKCFMQSKQFKSCLPSKYRYPSERNFSTSQLHKRRKLLESSGSKSNYNSTWWRLKIFTELQIKLAGVKLCCLWLISPIPSWISNMDRTLVLFWLENFAGISFQNTFWPVNGFVCPVEAEMLFNFFWKVNFLNEMNTKFHVY